MSNIVAGEIIAKDPTLTNTGDNNAYGYIMVEIPKVYETDITGDDGVAVSQQHYPLFSFEANDNWELVDSQVGTEDDAYDYYLYAYKDALVPGDEVTLFDEVKFANITDNFVNTITDEAIVDLDIKVTGYAIQSDYYNGEATDAKSAWNLYATQNDWAFPVNPYEGISTLNFVNEENITVHTVSNYPGTPVDMYFEPGLAKDGYTFNWVDETTGEVAYSGMPMPNGVTNLNASYTETGYGEQPSEFLEYTLLYDERVGLYAQVDDVYKEDGYAGTADDNFTVHPAAPDLTQPYSVIIPTEITLTIEYTAGLPGRYYAIYTGIDSYGFPVAIPTNGAHNSADSYLPKVEGQTITIPVLGTGERANNEEFENAETIVLSDGVADFRVISWGSLNNHKTLKNLILPYGIKELNLSVNNCTQLENLYLPATLTKISTNVFKGCTALKEVNIPTGLKSANAFSGCTNLEKLNFTSLEQVFTCGTNAYTNGIAGAYVNGVLVEGSVMVPNTIEAIASSAMTGNKYITEITIPSGITTIGDSAFEGCKNLKKVTMENTVTEIARVAFRDCTSLTDIKISENINKIGPFAFRNTGFYNDTNNWEGSMLYLGHCLIVCEESRNSKPDIIVKDGTTVIAAGAFQTCGATTITIPEGVTDIPLNCFLYGNITNIVLPSSIKTIGDSAFSTSSLSTIYFAGSEEDWNAIEKSPYADDNHPNKTFDICEFVFNHTY